VDDDSPSWSEPCVNWAWGWTRCGAYFTGLDTGPKPGQARERGVAPGSPQAAQLVDRLTDGADAAKRDYIRQRLEAGLDSQSDRYHQLLAVINGQPPRPSRAVDLEWLIAAIESYAA
jgi:hypothetical protein